MSNLIGRVCESWLYSRGMGRRSKPKRVEIERRPEDIDRWVGMWVAVKGGEVIAAAHNSRELVPMVRSMGESGRGAVAQFVPQRSDEIMIGVG
jgi:hypothetical protein